MPNRVATAQIGPIGEYVVGGGSRQCCPTGNLSPEEFGRILTLEPDLREAAAVDRPNSPEVPPVEDAKTGKLIVSHAEGEP